MGAPVSFGGADHRERLGFLADVFPVRSDVLDGVAHHQSHRAAQQRIQPPNQCDGSDGRRNLNLSLFGLCSTNHGIPLEFSSAFSMVHRLHTKCRLTVKDERNKRQRTEGLAMSLTTPSSVQKLQTALHAKAKESPDFRFYALYDKVYRKDVLAYAYERCKANGGAAGVDNQTFEDIEQYGTERWSDELTRELKSRTYQPLPVRRVYIPKPDGKQRPLGIPAIRDRTAEMAAVLVLEPIFEADLQPEQYAYRRDRSALDAVRHVHKLINTGHGEIVEADLRRYFDSVPDAA